MRLVNTMTVLASSIGQTDDAHSVSISPRADDDRIFVSILGSCIEFQVVMSPACALDLGRRLVIAANTKMKVTGKGD